VDVNAPATAKLGQEDGITRGGGGEGKKLIITEPKKGGIKLN
jgi:hypothetical protein